jgi:hypothetical protein
LGSGTSDQGDVTVIITADNAYGFGYGTSTDMANYFGGVENFAAADIFSCPIGKGPEQYTVAAKDASAGAYLYIVSWADRSTTQGVIGQFARQGADAIYTGVGHWEVCATGKDYDPGSKGPPPDVIKDEISQCDQGTTPSKGWVDSTGTDAGKLEFGEDNTTPYTGGHPVAGNEFPVVCGIDGKAKWMWYNWDPANIQWPTKGSPFIWPGGSGNPIQDFLIFRLSASEIPGPVH